jgi:hypothetical protein
MGSRESDTVLHVVSATADQRVRNGARGHPSMIVPETKAFDEAKPVRPACFAPGRAFFITLVTQINCFASENNRFERKIRMRSQRTIPFAWQGLR